VQVPRGQKRTSLCTPRRLERSPPCPASSDGGAVRPRLSGDAWLTSTCPWPAAQCAAAAVRTAFGVLQSLVLSRMPRLPGRWRCAPPPPGRCSTAGTAPSRRTAPPLPRRFAAPVYSRYGSVGLACPSARPHPRRLVAVPPPRPLPPTPQALVFAPRFAFVSQSCHVACKTRPPRRALLTCVYASRPAPPSIPLK
jgi:hypothetical protein